MYGDDGSSDGLVEFGVVKILLDRLLDSELLGIVVKLVVDCFVKIVCLCCGDGLIDNL